MASMCVSWWERQISAGLLCLRALGSVARIPESQSNMASPQTAPWLRSTRAPWTNFLLEVQASDIGFLQPGNESHFIPPSIRLQMGPTSTCSPAAQGRGLKCCCNFNLSTPLFNKGEAVLQTQAPSCSLHPVCLKTCEISNPSPCLSKPDCFTDSVLLVFLIERANCDVMKQWCASWALQPWFSWRLWWKWLPFMI